MSFIAALKHRVKLCSQDDVIVNNQLIRLNRKEVLSCRAQIATKGGVTFTNNSYNADRQKAKRTHTITMFRHRGMDVSGYAWLYEERRISGDRWFKILRVDETMHPNNGMPIWVFDVMLAERGIVPAPAPAEEDKEAQPNGLPPGVTL